MVYILLIYNVNIMEQCNIINEYDKNVGSLQEAILFWLKESSIQDSFKLNFSDDYIRENYL